MKRECLHIGMILLIPFIVTFIAWGQDSCMRVRPVSFQITGEMGKVLPINDYLKTIDQGYMACAVKVRFQTTGNEYWQQLYNYPQFGFGIYRGQLDPESAIGKPYAVYSFFSIPFYRDDKRSINYEMNYGVAYFYENVFNVAISSSFSGYFSSGFSFEQSLGRYLDVGIFLGFTHFSNGAFQKPNLGVNILSPKVFLVYIPHRDQHHFQQMQLPPLKKKNALDVSIYYGMKNLIYMGTDLDSITKYRGVDFTVYGLSLVANRQVSYLSRVGLGLTFGYNQSYNSPLVVENAKLVVKGSRYCEKLALSVYPSYELLIDRFAVVLQPGFYVYRVDYEEISPVFYQRIGLKYHVTDYIFTGFNLRAYEFSVADFIEWNVGWRFVGK